MPVKNPCLIFFIMSCLGFQALRLHSLPITGYMTSNDFHSDSWVCAGTSRRREIESEAVVSQPDAIIQNTDTIVLACSAREHVGSHLRHRFYVNGLLPIEVPALKNFFSIHFGKMIRNKVRGMGLNRRASKKITDSRRLRLSHEEDCLDPFVRLFCLPDVWGDFFTSGKYLCSENS